MYRSLLPVLLTTVILCLCRAQQGPLQLIVNRDAPDDPVNHNNLRLLCRETEDFNIIDHSDYRFWVNTTQNELRAMLDPNSYMESDNGFRFRITRDLEGHFFCGPNSFSISTMESIIAYPSTAILPMKRVRAQMDSDAELPPLVSPGKLLQQYYIDWTNSNGQNLGRILGPRSSQPFPNSDLNNRFSVDPQSFALTIRSVTFEDRGLYIGSLGVSDPRGRQFPYTQTQTKGIYLEVYVPPTFIEPPQDRVVALTSSFNSEQMVSYHCKAKGAPTLTITWTHNGRDVSRDRAKYNVQTAPSGEDNFMMESTLVIQALNNYDSGNVSCVAMVTLEEGNPIVDSCVAHLSVLGEVERLITFITVSQTIIFRVYLASEMAAEVQLFIEFTDVNTGNKYCTLSASHFAQSREITHFEETIPYQQFTVQVGLMYQSMRGPLGGNQVTYDRSQPTEQSQILIMYLVPGVCSLLGLIVVSVFIVVLCLSFRCGRKKVLKLGFKLNRKCTRLSFLNKHAVVDSNILQRIFKKIDENGQISAEEVKEIFQHNEEHPEPSHNDSIPTLQPPSEAAGGPPLPYLAQDESYQREESVSLIESGCCSRIFCWQETEKEKRAKDSYTKLKGYIKSIREPNDDQARLLLKTEAPLCTENMQQNGVNSRQTTV